MFSQQVFDEFFKHSNVGLAVLDEDFRFCCINQTLASINGRLVEQHPGKHIREILGAQIASRLEPVITAVLKTSRPIVNVNLNGRLPARPEAGQWLCNYFPLPDSCGVPRHVGAVVVELNPENNILASRVPAGEGPQKILRSWKEIAHYAGTCAKTVQRWERSNHLPIHRVSEAKGSVVFALSDELEGWLRSQKVRYQP